MESERGTLASPEQHTALANRGSAIHLKKKKNTGCATRWSATNAARSPGRGAASMSLPSTKTSRKESTAPARRGRVLTQKGRPRTPKKVEEKLEFLRKDH